MNLQDHGPILGSKPFTHFLFPSIIFLISCWRVNLNRVLKCQFGFEWMLVMLDLGDDSTIP